MVKAQPKNNFLARNWRWLVTVVLLVLTAVVLVRNADVLAKSFEVLKSAQPGAVLLAVGLTFLMFLVAATMYLLLAFTKLPIAPTVLVEFAAAAVNRLLPGGIGGLGVHGLYLYRKGHTGAQATAVVALNNLLGITIHITLITVLFMFIPNALVGFTVPPLGSTQYIVVGLLLALLAVVYFVPKWRVAVKKFVINLGTSLVHYSKHPIRFMCAILLAATVSLLYTLVLYVLVGALDLSISVVACFLIFSLSVITATATPTPGGVLGAEAGLFAGFVAYGFSAEQALAAALLFRLVTYWLPIVPGLIALLFAKRASIL